MYECRIRGTKKVLRYSCPPGMTEDDLEELFSDASQMNKFRLYMVGQTMSVCDGTQFHHNRVHNDYCMGPITPSYAKTFPEAYQHTEDSPHDWRCGYDGGYVENTECRDNPHGVVAYPSDVSRFLLGLPVID